MRSLNEIKENIKEIHGDKYDLSYLTKVPYKSPLTVLCPIHGFFYPTYDNLVNKRSGCPYCSNVGRKTTEQFIVELKEIFGDKYAYGKVKYVNAKTEVTLTCPIHGDFKRTPNKLLSQHQGCNKCKRLSKLESITENYFVRNNIEFVYEKHFPWLGKQSLDFYLPECNIAIECQGEPHFKQVFYKGRQEVEKRNKLENIILRDIKKYELCQENGIKLFYLIDERYPLSYIKNINAIYTEENSYYCIKEIFS